MASFRVAAEKTRDPERSMAVAGAAGKSEVESLYQRGVQAFRAGNFTGTVRFLREAVEKEPERPEASLLLGLAYYRLSQYPAAITALEQAVALAPGSQTAHWHLGLLYEQQQRPDEAAEHWRQFLATNPETRQAEMARKHLELLKTRVEEEGSLP